MINLVPTTPCCHAVLVCMAMASLLLPLDTVNAFSPARCWSPPVSNRIPGSRRHHHAPLCFSSKRPNSSPSSSTTPLPFWKQHPASSAQAQAAAAQAQAAASQASSLSSKASNSGNFWNSQTENKNTEPRNNGVRSEKEGAAPRMGDLVTATAMPKGGGDRPGSTSVRTTKAVKTDSRLSKKNGNGEEEDDDNNSMFQNLDAQTFLYGAGAVVVASGLTLAHSLGLGPQDAIEAGQRFFADPQQALQDVVESVRAMGPLAPVYFGIMYLIAEILAIPATPLTLSAGYLFGLYKGVGVVLLAASIAASISFFIGKTFLRSWVETVLEENTKFAKIDKAIAKEGFKLLLLVRLSPIFPFALSNYLYGASAIDFGAFFWGTLLGFTPGTVAYVYTGMVGKALTLGEGEPWYVYAGGFTALLAFLKIVTDVATNIVDAIEDDDDDVINV